ncbi:MAG: helix-turn-helix domain-containing protein [Oleibacter sp.]|nr:helix-turn-helix domain-containing protein [Thalassolituus sp.]
MGVRAQVDSLFVKQAIEHAADNGLHIEELWEKFGVNPNATIPQWVPSKRVASAYHWLDRQFDDELWSCRIGARIASLDMPWQRLVKTSKNIRLAFETIIPYFYLATTSVSYSIENCTLDKEVAIIIEPLADKGITPFQICAAATPVAILTRDVLGITSDREDFRMLIPTDFVSSVDILSDYLGIRVVESERFEVRMSEALWEQISPNYDVDTYKAGCAELVRLDKRFREYEALYQELRNIIVQCLNERDISQENSARLLEINVRNLQRRLRALGTTYRQLLDEIRYERAIELIHKPNIPLYEIAYRLCFSEPSAFYKAFRRWTGAKPGDYRRAHNKKINEVLVEDE